MLSNTYGIKSKIYFVLRYATVNSFQKFLLDFGKNSKNLDPDLYFRDTGFGLGRSVNYGSGKMQSSLLTVIVLYRYMDLKEMENNSPKYCVG